MEGRIWENTVTTDKFCNSYRTSPPNLHLPFYAVKNSFHLLASQWDFEHSLHEKRHTFLQQVEQQCPPVVVFGAEKYLLAKRVIAHVNASRNRPVIVAIVESDDEPLLAACYKQGADRVVAVPYCSARIFRALLSALQSRDIYCAPYRFNAATQTCSIGARVIRLTTKSFNIAQYLFANQGKLIPKSTILKDVWGLESNQCITRRIEVHMCNVRKQLSLDGSLGWEIRSRRKMGYGIFPVAQKTTAT